MLKNVLQKSTVASAENKTCLYIGTYFGAIKPAKFASLSENAQNAFLQDKDTVQKMNDARSTIKEIANAIGYKLTKADALEENGSAIFTAMLLYIAEMQEKESKVKK